VYFRRRKINVIFSGSKHCRRGLTTDLTYSLLLRTRTR